MKDPRIILTNGPDNVWSWLVPSYRVTNEGIEDADELVIDLCRGDKLDENRPRQAGLFTETMLQVCKQYLEGVNVGPMATRETSMAITKIDEALMWIQKRADDRKRREVQGTYLK